MRWLSRLLVLLIVCVIAIGLRATPAQAVCGGPFIELFPKSGAPGTEVTVAGDRFDAEILQYIKQKYKLLIGERTAEEIKVKIGTVFPKARNEELDIRGRDMVSGLPRTVTVYSEEVEEALRESVSVIVQASKSVLERTPPELSADIIDRGVILTGGGALLHGMDQLLAEELKVPVLIAENPMGCVAVGTGIMLDNIDKLSRRNIV